MQAIAYIQIRKVATATIRPMGESPCSSAVSIQSSSLRIDLLLHFVDEAFGVLDQGQGAGVACGNVDLSALVGEDKAAAVASGVGLLNSLTELAGLHILGKAAKPVLDSIMAKFGSKATAALEDLTVRQALVGAGKSLALGTGQEVATEVIQEVNSIVGEELGKAWSGIDSELTAEAFFDRLQETAIQTAKAMVVLGGISAGPVMYSNMAKVNRAKANKATLDRIIEAHKQARATQLTPDAAQELLDAQATDAGISQVWVDAQAFSQAMIDHGVTKQDLKQILPEVAEQIDSASANGGDIVLPTARYASALGGT